MSHSRPSAWILLGLDRKSKDGMQDLHPPAIVSKQVLQTYLERRMTHFPLRPIEGGSYRDRYIAHEIREPGASNLTKSAGIFRS